MATTAPFVDSRDFARIARAIRYVDSHYASQPRLAEIARHVGLSEFHFNRLFRRWAGVTPKQYLAAVTARAAQRALGEEPSVLDAAHAVGLSGPGRLHDLTVSFVAMTPGELRAQGATVAIRFGHALTPFGDAVIAATARGLCRLEFADGAIAAALERAQSHLHAEWPRATLVRDDAAARSLARRIWVRERGTQALPLAVTGTNFQLAVWRALLAIEPATTTTYGELATQLGEPRSARAVGNAVGANPVAWLIPCHRVLRAGGALGGYAWGIERKQAILAFEAARAVQ